MRRAALILAMGCGRQINPEWCAQAGHTDPACDALIDARSVGCTRNEECPGSTCLAGGTCAGPDAMLYASPNGGGTACTSAAKCLLVTAISNATADRNIIMLDPATYTGSIAIDRSLHIVGMNAILEGGPSGAAVTVMAGVTAELDDVSITGAVAGSGIACANATLRAHRIRVTGNQQGILSRCTLTLDHSVIASNSDGGLAVMTGQIDVRNNFIVNNGSDSLMRISNVAITNGVTGSFSFNTVAYNNARQNSNPGVDCRSAAVVAEGNIVTDNTQKGEFGVNPQVVGTCDFTRSYTEPGTGNNDLHWVNVVASDFHLTAESTPVLDSATVACGDTDDIDGQSRPQGAGCDFGADELTPTP